MFGQWCPAMWFFGTEWLLAGALPDAAIATAPQAPAAATAAVAGITTSIRREVLTIGEP